MTADVDVTVALGRGTKAALLASLHRAGFPSRLSLSDAYQALHVDIPEADYPRLRTLGAAVTYLVSKR